MRDKDSYEVGSGHKFLSNPLDCEPGSTCTGKVTTASTSAAHRPVTHGGGLRSALQEHSRLSWRKAATGAAILLAVGMGYHVIFGRNGVTVFAEKRHETQSLAGQLQSLQHENEQLRGHVERLQNDPGSIEHQAREELHYTRPGEVIYTLPPETAKKISQEK